jgi:hypothetical protein
MDTEDSRTFIDFQNILKNHTTISKNNITRNKKIADVTKALKFFENYDNQTTRFDARSCANILNYSSQICKSIGILNIKSKINGHLEKIGKQ